MPRQDREPLGDAGTTFRPSCCSHPGPSTRIGGFAGLPRPPTLPSNGQAVTSWTDREPTMADAREELRCAIGRLRVRWPMALALTLGLTIAGSAWRARKQRSFQSTIVMRVTEDSFDRETAPPTPGQLQRHLLDVAFSRGRLLRLIRKNHLYGSSAQKDPSLALESIHDDIELYVLANYFAVARYSGDPPRSAKIAISYTGRTPEQALSVVRQLGALVVTEQRDLRREYSIRAARNATDIVASLRTQWQAAHRQATELRFRLPLLSGTDQAAAAIALGRIQTRLKSLESELSVYQAQDTEFHLRRVFEGEISGLRFELVDPGRLARVLLTNRERIVAFGILLFLFLAPLVVIGIGTFDATVRDLVGLRRLALSPFGRVPAFKGIDGLHASASGNQ